MEEKIATSQKIVKYIIYILTASIFFSLFIAENFSIAPHYSNIVNKGSAILTVIFNISLIILNKINWWEPSLEYYYYSPIKKAIAIVGFPFITFLLIWPLFHKTIPYIYTAAFGYDAIIEKVVSKHKNTSRRSIGTYYLIPKNYHFDFCRILVSEEQYNKFPSDEVNVQLFVKQSPFGYIVNGYIINK